MKSVDHNELEIMDSWMETIAESNVGDLLIDLSEVGLDNIVDNELVKEVPVIKTVVSVYKLGHTLRERSYVRKLAGFLNEISKGTVDNDKKEEYLRRITKNKAIFQHELEYVLILLDRFISEDKSKLLGRLYVARINEQINWIGFCQYSEVVDRLFIGDFECLHRDIMENKNRNEFENSSLQRLQGLGLVKPCEKASGYDINGNPLLFQQDGTYVFTTFGENLYDILR